MARILVVDDDANLREVVRYALERAGHEVCQAADGLAGWQAFEQDPPDLAVLDVIMPELDGLELCRRIRAAGSTPVLFLSTRSEELDRVLGLELGGDDYLCKPFSPRELVSRVKAVLRRTQATAPASSTVLEAGPVRMDTESWQVRCEGAAVQLTVTEFRILRVLVRRPGRAWPREALVAEAYPDAHHVSARTLDSHVRNIRSKLGGSGSWLETVHGLGYRWRDT